MTVEILLLNDVIGILVLLSVHYGNTPSQSVPVLVTVDVNEGKITSQTHSLQTWEVMGCVASVLVLGFSDLQELVYKVILQ